MGRSISELDFRQRWCWAGDERVMGPRMGRGLADCGGESGESLNGRAEGRVITEAPSGEGLWQGGEAGSRPGWLAAKWKRVGGLVADVGGHRFPFPEGLCYPSSSPGFPLLCPTSVPKSSRADKPATAHKTTFFPLTVRSRSGGDRMVRVY